MHIERAKVHDTGGMERLELMKDLINVLVLGDGNTCQFQLCLEILSSTTMRLRS